MLAQTSISWNWAAARIGDHLWQSTLIAGLAWAAAIGLKRHAARVRYGLWLAASIKFLVPLSLLVGLGRLVGGILRGEHGAAPAPAPFYTIVEEVSQPFSSVDPVVHSGHLAQVPALLPEAVLLLWLVGATVVLTRWWLRWRRIAAVASAAKLVECGREVEAMQRVQRTHGRAGRVPLRVARGAMEPGVFGIVQPLLLWPEGISEHLDDGQLEAILAHEVCHVRRRDNLAAALHMGVEALFWFHPLVWWVGTRLVEERELACDEAVLRQGAVAAVYAEGILKACRFCVESPLACVSGVSGSNLKRRIEQIMQSKQIHPLTKGGQLLLTSLACAFVLGPVALGSLHPQNVLAEPMQSSQPGAEARFSEATVTVSHAGNKFSNVQVRPDGFTETNATLKDLIEFAYGVQSYQISSVDDWIDADRFDVEGKWQPDAGAGAPEMQALVVTALPGNGPANGVGNGPGARPASGPQTVKMQIPPGQLQIRLRALLAERFHLKLRDETKDSAVYTLVAAPGGTKLSEVADARIPKAPNGEAMIRVRTQIKNGTGELTMQGPLGALAGFLSTQVSREVVDKTGLQGNYAVTLQWKTEPSATESIAAALEEQLGLKLDSGQGPVKMLFVEKAEKPGE